MYQWGDLQVCSSAGILGFVYSRSVYRLHEVLHRECNPQRGHGYLHSSASSEASVETAVVDAAKDSDIEHVFTRRFVSIPSIPNVFVDHFSVIVASIHRLVLLFNEDLKDLTCELYCSVLCKTHRVRGLGERLYVVERRGRHRSPKRLSPYITTTIQEDMAIFYDDSIGTKAAIPQ